jgi:DNA-directed RNA polymerase specialized sigma subunit
MLESTIRRYQIVRKEVYKRLGKMPTMVAYSEVAKEMGMTEETVRKIIRKINKWDMVPTKK